METKGFFIGEVVKGGWKTFKSHVWFFIGLLLIVFFIQFIPNVIAEYLKIRGVQEHKDSFLVYSFIVSVITFMISLLMSMGLIKVSLRLTNNEAGKFSDLFTTFPKIIKFLIAWILYGILLLIGLILLVFPMFIWGTRYSLFPFFMIDQGVGPLRALELSAKTTMGAKWDLFGYWLMSVALNLMGVFCIIIGLFATIPVVLIAHALIYRKLVAQTKFE